MHLCLLQVDSDFAGTAILSSSPCIQIDAKAEFFQKSAFGKWTGKF